MRTRTFAPRSLLLARKEVIALARRLASFLGDVGTRATAARHQEKTMKIQRILSLIVGIVIVAIAGSAGAQAPVAPPPPQIPYGPPITLDQAKKALAGAEAEARKNNWSVVITVLDSGGHMVAMHRIDGTQLGSIEAAQDKAYSAVLYRRPTKVFQDLVAQGGANMRLLRLAGASPLEGGIPLILNARQRVRR